MAKHGTSQDTEVLLTRRTNNKIKPINKITKCEESKALPINKCDKLTFNEYCLNTLSIMGKWIPAE